MAKKRKQEETHVHITPAGLEALCTEIWGKEWRAKFSEVTGISYSQLHRYMTIYNGQRIPQVVVVALEGLRMLKTGPEGVPMLSIDQYRQPVSEAKPVKVAPSGVKGYSRPDDGTPVVDFFGDAAAEPPPAPAKPTPKVKTAPKAKPAPETAAKPGKAASKAGPAKARTGGTGPAKAGPEKAGPAKAKPETAPKPVTRKPPKRAALAKA